MSRSKTPAAATPIERPVAIEPGADRPPVRAAWNKSNTPNLLVTPVAKSQPRHLRLHQPEPPATAIDQDAAAVDAVRTAFQRATGWTCELSLAAPKRGPIQLEPLAADTPDSSANRLERGAALPLATALVNLVDRLEVNRRALWQREAELAAGVPIAPRPDEPQHLAARLEAVLQGACRAIGCQAAAMYMLDEATTSLKLRSAWGLPLDRLTVAPRSLANAIADLEALTGHVVVLRDPALSAYWSPPEDYPAAVCVPVSGLSMPLGTLWLFAGRERDFSDDETNLAEIIAGRLAADLEREILLSEAVQSARRIGDEPAKQRWAEERPTRFSPAKLGWEIAEWRMADNPEAPVGLCDWFVPAEGRLSAVVAGHAAAGPQGQLAATALRHVLRALAPHRRRSDRLLEEAGRTLWSAATGPQGFAVGYALLENATGRVRWASAGPAAALLFSGKKMKLLGGNPLPLATEPDAVYRQQQAELAPGEVLVLACGFEGSIRRPGPLAQLPGAEPPSVLPAGDAALDHPLATDAPLERLLAAARDLFEPDGGPAPSHGRALVVVRRTR